MDMENKGNYILLAKWFFLKPQNVLESIQNSNVDLSPFVTLLVHAFQLCRAGESFIVFYSRDRKMWLSTMKVNLQISLERLSIIHPGSTEYLSQSNARCEEDRAMALKKRQR